MLLLVTFKGRSLTKLLNNSQLRIEPCGTPDAMGRELDITPWKLSVVALQDRT